MVKPGGTKATSVDTTPTTLTATDNTIDMTFTALRTAVSAAEGNPVFNFLADRVYTVCAFVGLLKDAAFSTA